MSRRKRTLVVRTCEICGASFLAREDCVKVGGGRYCSRKCQVRNRRRNLTIPTATPRRQECGRAAIALINARGKNRHPGEQNGNWHGGRDEEKLRQKRARYQQKYPEKARAKRVVREALRSGKLVKGPCTVCGTTANIHGHHADYSRPLDVTWLCGRHHREVHSF